MRNDYLKWFIFIRILSYGYGIIWIDPFYINPSEKPGPKNNRRAGQKTRKTWRIGKKSVILREN